MTSFKEVDFWRIPVGLTFEHQGEYYTKIGEEKVLDSDGKEWVFEIHYGCIIHRSLFACNIIKQKDDK